MQIYGAVWYLRQARERTETPVHTYLVLATSSAFVRTGSKAASRLARLVRRPAQSTARS
jgi:hypothetical protein